MQPARVFFRGQGGCRFVLLVFAPSKLNIMDECVQVHVNYYVACCALFGYGLRAAVDMSFPEHRGYCMQADVPCVAGPGAGNTQVPG